MMKRSAKEEAGVSTYANITFQDALELIETLPEDQQESLIQILQLRIVERRRERLASNIQKARKEFQQGEMRTGTVTELMKEIASQE